MFKHSRPGATLFETLLTLITVGGLLAAGAVAITERQSDVRDKGSADHLRILSHSAERLLKENYAALHAAIPLASTANYVFNATTPVQGTVNIAEYLPPGYIGNDTTSRNGYRQQWRVVIARSQDPSVAATRPLQAIVVLREDASALPLRSNGSINRHEGAIIGLAGPTAGVVQNDLSVNGAFGGWQRPANQLFTGSGALTAQDRIVSVVASDKGGVFGEYLHRAAVPGFPELNRMTTNIDMNLRDINRVHEIGLTSPGLRDDAAADPTANYLARGTSSRIRAVNGSDPRHANANGFPGLEISTDNVLNIIGTDGIQIASRSDIRLHSQSQMVATARRNFRIAAGLNTTSGEDSIFLEGQNIFVGKPGGNLGNRGLGTVRAQSAVFRSINDVMFTAPEGQEGLKVQDRDGATRLVSLYDMLPRVNLRQIDGAFSGQRVPKPVCAYGKPYVITTLHSFQTADNNQPMPWENWVRAGSVPGAPTGPSAGGAYGNVHYRVGVQASPSDPANLNSAIAEARLSVPLRVRAVDGGALSAQDAALYPYAYDGNFWTIVVEHLNQFQSACGAAPTQNYNGEFWGPTRVTVRPLRPGEPASTPIANRCIYEDEASAGKPFVVVQSFCGSGDDSNRPTNTFGSAPTTPSAPYTPTGMGPNSGTNWSQPLDPTENQRNTSNSLN